MPRFPTRLIVILFLATLAGCSLFESRETAALRQSPDYRAGYSDGCATANSPAGSRGTTIRDDASYRSNRAYNMGWNSGRSMCRTGLSGADDPFRPITH